MFESDNAGKTSTYCGQTFAMLDKWMLQIAEERGAEIAFRKVKETFENNIKANVSYYEELAKIAQENNKGQNAEANLLMAKLYKGFLPTA